MVNEQVVVHTVQSQEDIISAHALAIAKNDIHQAMTYLQKHMPHLFMLNGHRSEK
jgi:oligoribonuclease (3'-5' exoribonuclease)